MEPRSDGFSVSQSSHKTFRRRDRQGIQAKDGDFEISDYEFLLMSQHHSRSDREVEHRTRNHP